MGYTVKVQHPHFPEGTIFNVGGLDRVPNGGSLEVDEETERLFILQHGQSVEDAFANDAIINVTGSSALDADEVKQLVESVNPPEEELATTDLVEETPAWMNTPTQEDEGSEE